MSMATHFNIIKIKCKIYEFSKAMMSNVVYKCIAL